MTGIIVLGLVLLAYILYPHGLGGGNQGGGTLVTITATGTSSAYPSQADFYLNMNGSGSTSQLAIANLSNTINLVNMTVNPYINGNTSLINTQYFNVYKAYNKSSFEAQESMVITIPNSQNATGALVALSGIPYVYINNVQSKLSTDQITALRSSALSMAIANATSQADAVSPGMTVSVVNITVNSYYVYPFPYPVYGGVGGGTVVQASNASAAINSLFYSGKSTVTESVTVVFSSK